ncbi:hypothetical protein CYMTET_23755 [Cymbomonas tetramitiformis]|uniref:peptidylprolyl isomerase n=1 Tax=Cymbomonas tetramitiformis TaxID=36881 RepID=A0AAE0L0M0_9CHLO|nr:hypothetical protein CYMTET_23755 [Cymbomonas tetramitiformis]
MKSSRQLTSHTKSTTKTQTSRCKRDVLHKFVCEAYSEPNHAQYPGFELCRRSALVSVVAVFGASPAIAADEIEVVSDEEGFGDKTIRPYSLTLVHFVGRNRDGEIFDSTRGGLKYLDGGSGVYRPYIINLSGGPVPGICEGITKGLLGMKVGGKRTVRVPPSLGFGQADLNGPYGAIPGGSDVTYEIEVLRISNNGPDSLMVGISNCGLGGANQQDSGCRDIVPQL